MKLTERDSAEEKARWKIVRTDDYTDLEGDYEIGLNQMSEPCQYCGFVSGHDGGCRESTMGKIARAGAIGSLDTEKSLLREIRDLLRNILQEIGHQC